MDMSSCRPSQVSPPFSRLWRHHLVALGAGQPLLPEGQEAIQWHCAAPDRRLHRLGRSERSAATAAPPAGCSSRPHVAAQAVDKNGVAHFSRAAVAAGGVVRECGGGRGSCWLQTNDHQILPVPPTDAAEAVGLLPVKRAGTLGGRRLLRDELCYCRLGKLSRSRHSARYHTASSERTLRSLPAAPAC